MHVYAHRKKAAAQTAQCAVCAFRLERATSSRKGIYPRAHFQMDRIIGGRARRSIKALSLLLESEWRARAFSSIKRRHWRMRKCIPALFSPCRSYLNRLARAPRRRRRQRREREGRSDTKISYWNSYGTISFRRALARTQCRRGERKRQLCVAAAVAAAFRISINDNWQLPLDRARAKCSYVRARAREDGCLPA